MATLHLFALLLILTTALGTKVRDPVQECVILPVGSIEVSPEAMNPIATDGLRP